MRALIRTAPKQAYLIRTAEENATIGAVRYTDMPKGQSRHDKLQRDVITLIELRDAYNETLAELEAMRKQLTPLIDKLESADERAVMRLRYLSGHSPEVIADSQLVPMARMTVYRYLRKAEANIKAMS